MDTSRTAPVGPGERPVNRKRNTKFLAGGAVISVVLLGLVVWAMNRPGSTAFYLTTTELHQAGDELAASEYRVNGNVVPGTVERDGLETTFDISDGTSVVTIYTDRPLPDAFQDRAETEIVARGTFDGQTFAASEVLAKCPSKFKAKEA